MIDYSLEVYNLDPTNGTYTRIGEVTTYYDLEWNLKANKPSYCNFSVNVYSPDAKFVQPFRNWVLIKRNGTPYLFNITNVRGGLQPDTGSLRVECMDIHYTLNQIYTEGSYVAQGVDAATTASNLVALAQAKSYANYGIQNGTIQGVGTSNETLFYGSIGEALTNQSDNIIGYDIQFVPVLDSDGKLASIRFDAFKSLGVVRTSLPPLELGYSVNIVHFGMGGEVYNKIYTIGAETGEEVEVAESSDTASQNYFGLRELVKKEPSVEIRSTLKEKGDEFLRKAKGVKLELGFQLTEGISPYFGDFGLFDTLGVDISIGNTFFNFSGTAQVREIIFNYDNQTNKETVTPIIEYYKT